MGPVDRRRPAARLSSDEVALVMRRAAELDSEDDQPDADGIDAAAVEAAAREVGLPTSAVRQALAELHAGSLEPTGRRGRSSAELRRPVEARVVTAAPPTVHATIENLLHQQTFVRRTGHWQRAVFRRRFDLSAKLRRLFDLRGIIQLAGVRTVILTVSHSGDQRHLVRLEAQLSGLPSRARALVVATAIGVFTGVALAGAILFDGALAIGGVAYASAIGAWLWLGRRLLRRRNEEVRETLAGFLDSVEAPFPP